MMNYPLGGLQDDNRTEQCSASVPEAKDLSQIIRIDEAKVSGHLNDLVRKTVQETLNEMLDAEGN